MRAGNGRDSVAGGGGRDEVYGGGGNDTINAKDGFKDAVNCGTGTDTAYVDKRDVVNRDRENVFGAGQPKAGTPKAGTPIGPATRPPIEPATRPPIGSHTGWLVGQMMLRLPFAEVAKR